MEAVCPIGVEGFDAEGRLCFHRGTPLRYAQHSPRTAFLHPRFCFGPAAFFQQVAHSDGPRFLAAFQQRWDIYTLRLPLTPMDEAKEAAMLQIMRTHGLIS